MSEEAVHDLNTEKNVDEVDDLPEAPDGGYGWVVVAASFVIGMIVDGCLFTFGIMTLEFVDQFQTNKMTIALAGSVMNGVYLSVGPLVSGLCNKFGCKFVAVAGSVVAALGFVTCIFSTNVATLITTYGALAGVGFGMMHLPSIVMVGFYFTKKRAFATGLAMCGSGIGAFIFAPIIQQLLYVYHWRGAQLILAGFILQGCVMGLLFKPINILKNELVDDNTEMKLLNENEMESNHVSLHSNRGALLRKDIFYSGSLLSLPDYQDHQEGPTESLNHRKSNQKLGEMSSNLNLSALEVRRQEEEKGRRASCFKSFVSFVDFSLLKNPTFVMYGISCFFTMAGFFIPFMFLPELVVSQGWGRDRAALLLSIIGIANTSGRVIVGWVSDRPQVNCLVVNILALIMGGLALALIPLLRSVYVLLCIASALFGLSIAVFASLRSIIMVELMGLDKLTNAFGLVTMFQGLSTFIGNPLAGAIYDATADYNTLFLFAGSLLILAGLACVACRYLAIMMVRKERLTSHVAVET